LGSADITVVQKLVQWIPSRHDKESSSLVTPMYHTLKRRYVSRTLLILSIITLVLLSHAAAQAPAAASAVPEQPHQPAAFAAAAQFAGVAPAARSAIQLDPASAIAPQEPGPYEQYGYYLSPVQALETPATRFTVAYAASTPGRSAALLDVRASADGETWTSWQTDLSSGEQANFATEAHYVQYRARLFANGDARPTVDNVQVRAAAPQEVAEQATEAAAPGYAPVAPTYRIRATRLGLVGYRTANGHIIRPRDHFVSLPSWRSLSSRGGNEYMVRISYQGRTAVAPVWDVGPWNTVDDYWAPDRRGYSDLPTGWPQDHAAYFHGYNGGRAEYGYVRFPTAVDVADGIWWDKLGIHGDQAVVEITFLWQGQDPRDAELLPPDPAAGEYRASELGPFFHPNQSPWRRSPMGCGEGHHAYWTLTITEEAQRENEAFWQPTLPSDGMYDVYAHIPICTSRYEPTTGARYLIEHAEGADEVIVNQATETHWVHLGRFPFKAGDEGFVYLSDLAGDRGRAVWFDDMRWVPVRE
jgi:hypothetical protein